MTDEIDSDANSTHELTAEVARALTRAVGD